MEEVWVYTSVMSSNWERFCKVFSGAVFRDKNRQSFVMLESQKESVFFFRFFFCFHQILLDGPEEQEILEPAVSK